jgi:hypothetical protein
VVDMVKLAATAKRLIEKDGHSRTVTLYKPNSEPANASQPWRGPVTDEDPSSGEGGGKLTCKAAFVPVRGTGLGHDAQFRGGDNEGAQGETRDVREFALIAVNSLPAGTDLKQYTKLKDGTNLRSIYFAALLKPGSVGAFWELALSA